MTNPPIKPVNAYLPVDVNDELPDRDGKVLARSEYGGYKITNGYHIKHNHCTFWLKEQSLFVFTKEELIKLLGDAFEKMYSYGNDSYKETEKQRFIKSILP